MPRPPRTRGTSRTNANASLARLWMDLVMRRSQKGTVPIGTCWYLSRMYRIGDPNLFPVAVLQTLDRDPRRPLRSGQDDHGGEERPQYDADGLDERRHFGSKFGAQPGPGQDVDVLAHLEERSHRDGCRKETADADPRIRQQPVHEEDD